MLSDLFTKMWDAAYALNSRNILRMLEHNPNAVVLDVGCDDGQWSQSVAKQIGARELHGIEIVDKRRTIAEERGVICTSADLNERWPYTDSTFDVIHANQVIEHVSDIDHFLSEQLRILKPGGYVVISTENASSWCNIFASILGWQIFSLSNLSCRRGGVGNPLAIHRGEDANLPSWRHKTILNFRGLVELMEVWGFSVVHVQGAGYYPLPAAAGNLDKRHSHFMTVKAIKPV